jgi:uncharacterized protein YjgD (DUF1641 family)
MAENKREFEQKMGFLVNSLWNTQQGPRVHKSTMAGVLKVLFKMSDDEMKKGIKRLVTFLTVIGHRQLF